MQTQVVILDRDGTIVVDRDYLSDPAGWNSCRAPPKVCGRCMSRDIAWS